MTTTPPTDAEKLAAAIAMMAEATALANAARLPSAQAAVDLLTGTKGQAFLTLLKAAVEASADDLAQSTSLGAEGSKQTLARIVTTYENSIIRLQLRVEALQPATADDAGGDAPDPTQA